MTDFVVGVEVVSCELVVDSVVGAEEVFFGYWRNCVRGDDFFCPVDSIEVTEIIFVLSKFLMMKCSLMNESRTLRYDI